MAKGKYEQWLEPDNLLRIAAWARDGLTDEQIAHNMGIATSTIYDWKLKHSEIAEALKKSKEIVDVEVENALLRSALGFYYTEQQAIKVKEVYYNDNGKRCEREDVKIVEVKKYNPPETTPQIFWLKNRKPADWRDKKEIDTNFNTNATLTLKETRELVQQVFLHNIQDFLELPEPEIANKHAEIAVEYTENE
jgi:hypothetical protein